MEHAGENGEQLSVDVELETYGDQLAAPSNQFFYKHKVDPILKH